MPVKYEKLENKRDFPNFISRKWQCFFQHTYFFGAAFIFKRNLLILRLWIEKKCIICHNRRFYSKLFWPTWLELLLYYFSFLSMGNIMWRTDITLDGKKQLKCWSGILKKEGVLGNLTFGKTFVKSLCIYHTWSFIRMGSLWQLPSPLICLCN